MKYLVAFVLAAVLAGLALWAWPEQAYTPLAPELNGVGVDATKEVWVNKTGEY